MARYLIASGPMQTTAGFAKLATGTAIKTLLQLKAGATNIIRVNEWGISFDGSAAATPGIVELMETDVAATVTASASADITKIDPDAIAAGDPTTALIAIGTAATGYNSSAEGAITSVRNLDAPQLIAPTNQFIKQFPLGTEPIIQNGKFARIRVTFGATVNCFAYMVVTI